MAGNDRAIRIPGLKQPGSELPGIFSDAERSGTQSENSESFPGGSRSRHQPAARKRRVLKVSCTAMDLRFATRPIVVGHYDRDAISGAEAIIDRELAGGELSMQYHLGLYAGQVGTATVVLMPQSEEERLRGSLGGAVVAGLGELGELTIETLTEAIRTGILCYLLQILANESAAGRSVPEEIKISSLLIGYNSTTHISIEDSARAIVRGTIEANQRFSEQTKQPLGVTDLELIELYLDTAISATKALQRVAARLNEDSTFAGMRIEAQAQLNERRGWRHRLDAQGPSSYWPRVIVTDDDCRSDQSPAQDARQAASSAAPPAEAAGPRTAIANRLRFVYLGPRARAESVLQQRQPGLIENLMAEAIAKPVMAQDFSRSLFQLLVPPTFKETARQISRMVLVLDAYTANLPWELMIADDEPLATRAAIVRQFVSGQFRTHVRPALERRAYVVGNPPTDGFDKVFPAFGRNALPWLSRAGNEAQTVAGIIRDHGFPSENIQSLIGTHPPEPGTGRKKNTPEQHPAPRAVEIINGLYRQHYRIVHIAAHGIYNMAGADGVARSGIVLSDGILITAAEFRAMEVVPDLVFLNCCHLGQVDAQPATPYNRLAYSLARELIEMGVRAVIVAGWAVDDAAAQSFAKTFYTAWLGDGKALGDAVFEARQCVYRDHGHRCNTWGAYQVYGDSGLMFEPKAVPSNRSAEIWRPVVPEELIDRLEGLRLDIAKSGEDPTPEEARNIETMVESLLKRSPAEWQDIPRIQFERARLFADLGEAYFDKARNAYMAALQCTSMTAFVPTRALEELARLEAHIGEYSGDVGLIQSALQRLDMLEGALLDKPETGGSAKASGGVRYSTPEHAALVASAYRRLVATQAQALIDSSPAKSPNPASVREITEALRKSIEAYGAAAGTRSSDTFNPYLALNGLVMCIMRDALTHAADSGEWWPWSEKQVKNMTAEARACTDAARSRYKKMQDVWDAVIPADVKLFKSILDRSLAQTGPEGDAAFRQVRKAYENALVRVRRTPKEIDSAAMQIRLLRLGFRVIERLLAAKKPKDPIPLDQVRALIGRLGGLITYLRPS